MAKGHEETVAGGREGRAGGLIAVLTGEGSSVAFELPPRGDLLIGRDPSCELFLDDSSLSRRHARLRVRGLELTLEDLASKNGTRIGSRALQEGQASSIQEGTVAELGAVLLTVLVTLPAPSRAQAEPPTSHDHDIVLTPSLQPIDSIVKKVAATNLPVLLLGETGVGKDVFAERIHALSPRAGKRLVRVHAAALAEGLFESELFGHEQGAFTGALRAKVGLLEAADGGTVFIDEVGELPLSIQVKFLRVLEDHRVQRVGAVTARKVDLRFVAATHRDLAEAAQRGEFRQDLYQRLRGVCLRIPPLRERRGEIPQMAEAFLRRAAPGKSFSAAVYKALARHPFWGNVRELRNVVERTALLARGEEIGPGDLVLGDETARAQEGETREGLSPEQSTEAQRIMAALKKSSGNQTAAAELLGISRRTLVYRLTEYGLARPRKKDR